MRPFRCLLTIVPLILAANTYAQPGKTAGQCGQNLGDSLLVFIGTKIEVKEMPVDPAAFDAVFKATYQVLEIFCGDYNGYEITFTVYDHYGRPDFENYDTVLLFVSRYKGKYYHEKYLFHPLYKAKDGQWASPYRSRDNDRYDDRPPPVNPEKIGFADSLAFDITGRKRQWVKRIYPEPYYRISGNKAIAVYGNYLQDVFELTKEILILRNDTTRPEVADVTLPHVQLLWEREITTSEQVNLLAAYLELIGAIKHKDAQKIRAVSLDTVVCAVCEGFSESFFYNDPEPIDSFIAASYRNFPGTVVWQQMERGAHRYERSTSGYPPVTGLPQAKEYIVFSVVVTEAQEVDDEIHLVEHRFSFTPVNKTLKFFKMESNWTGSRKKRKPPLHDNSL